MTASTTAKATPAKATKATAGVAESEVKDDVVNRIPSNLFENSILKEFCERYLATYDEISAYNKDVLADKDSEWNATKVMAKARELARPIDSNGEVNKEILSDLEAYEKAVTEMNKARRKVIDGTAKNLGINISATAERDPEKEIPLKEHRTMAIEIGKQLEMIAKMTSDKESGATAIKFLESFPMPAIGRDQVTTFGDDTKSSTPKYRVNIKVTNKDGAVLLEESGFTKTALALTQPVFGYPRGEALNADKLREAWEAAGNSADKTVSPVQFEDNSLTFVITKK